jgi:hypothetical protein
MKKTNDEYSIAVRGDHIGFQFNRGSNGGRTFTRRRAPVCPDCGAANVLRIANMGGPVNIVEGFKVPRVNGYGERVGTFFLMRTTSYHRCPEVS